MSMDLARKDFSTAPKYFIAGVDIGIAKATKTASEAVEAHAPVLIADGKVKPIAAPASAGTAVLTGLYGITGRPSELPAGSRAEAHRRERRCFWWQHREPAR